ncbi:PucR family transcriptional regulator [Atopococcus tabaci]|uniref:PucR family transcriptional regulator n=1 Tax=Atopococcus tabaci TaxID=269774 RepID=UPI00240A7270|nr:helix-turn-helix domain-containing protein [Atopococcus tabaci]
MQEDIDETIQYLNLDKEKQYRIIVFDFESLADPLTPSLFTRYTDALLNHSIIEFPEKLYVTRQRKVILIVPAQQTDIQRIKEKLRTILKSLSKNSLYSQIKTYVALSNEVKVKDLPLGYKQAFDTLKFLRLVNDTQLIASYQDIGIYQLFAETGNTESLRRFIPELLKTLRTFIDVNQNYSETADLLYVHPKTVRYRIDKLKEQYHMNFANPEETLHYSIALRLLDLIELNKPTDFVR